MGGSVLTDSLWLTLIDVAGGRYEQCYVNLCSLCIFSIMYLIAIIRIPN